MTAHVVMPEGHPGDRFLTQIGHQLETHFGIHHATLQIEIGDTDAACRLAVEGQV